MKEVGLCHYDQLTRPRPTVPPARLILLVTACASFASEPTLSLTGACPGQVQVQWSGASPSRIAFLLFSQETGRYNLPVGPCGGTVLGLGPEGLRVVQPFRTGPHGEGALRGYAAPIACGGYLQMLVHEADPSCTTSNVVQIPQ